MADVVDTTERPGFVDRFPGSYLKATMYSADARDKFVAFCVENGIAAKVRLHTPKPKPRGKR